MPTTTSEPEPGPSFEDPVHALHPRLSMSGEPQYQVADLVERTVLFQDDVIDDSADLGGSKWAARSTPVRIGEVTGIASTSTTWSSVRSVN